MPSTPGFRARVGTGSEIGVCCRPFWLHRGQLLRPARRCSTVGGPSKPGAEDGRREPRPTDRQAIVLSRDVTCPENGVIEG